VVLDGERIDIVGLDRQALDARIGLGIYDPAGNSSVGHATRSPFLEGEVHPLGERVFEGESDALGQTLLSASHHGPCAPESSVGEREERQNRPPGIQSNPKVQPSCS
jgi:hypothetical protein